METKLENIVVLWLGKLSLAKVKVHTLDIAPFRSESPPQKCSLLSYDTCSQGISQFYLHTHTFIRNRNEPYPPLSSQPQLVLIYQPRRDGRLSRAWCEVAQAEIRTHNLPIANPAHSQYSSLQCEEPVKNTYETS